MVNFSDSTDQFNNSAYHLLCPNTFIFCTNLIYSYYIMGQNLNLYQLLKYNAGKYIIYNCKSNIKQNGWITSGCQLQIISSNKMHLSSLIWWIAPSNKTWSEFWINLLLWLYIYNILFHYKALNSALSVHCLFQWIDGSVGLHEGIHFSAQHSHIVRCQHQDPAATLNTSLHQDLRKTRANWF